MPTLFRTDEWVKSTLGPAISGAHLYFCTQPAAVPSSEATGGPTPQASTYQDPNGVTALPQPISTDGFGHANAYIAPGTYTLCVYNNGSLMATYPDQSIGVSGGVISLNSLTGNVSVQGGSGISIAVVGSSVIVSSSVTGGVTSLNSLVGNVSIVAGTGISVSVVGSGIQVSGTTSPTGSYFIGPGRLQYPISQNGGAVAANNNEVRVYRFILPVQVTVSNVSFRLNAASGTPTVGVGIYDKFGNAVITTSWTVSGVQVNTNSIIPTTLPPDEYFLAQATSDAVNTQVYGDISPNSQQLAVFNAAAVNYGVAANPMVGTTMPAALGTLTADNSAWYNSIGAMFN